MGPWTRQSSAVKLNFLVPKDDEESKVLSLRANRTEITWRSSLPIYASEEFLKSESNEFGWVGGKNSEGHLRCALPYTVVRKPGFRMIRFRTGVVPLEGDLSLAEEKSFLNSVVDYFRASGADMIIPSGNHAIFRTYPDGAAFAPYGTFINNLEQPEEQLMAGIRKTFRQNIRKAVSAGVQVKCGMNYLEVAYQLVAETLQRSEVKFRSFAEFQSKIHAFREYVRIFVAEHEGVIQGCMVAPFSSNTAYNCYAGSRSKPILGSMHLLHWEAMRKFKDLGVKRFDFQGVRINPEKGSKQEGIMHYKQGFGGQLEQGYLWKFPLHSFKSIAYSVGVRMLMGGDIVDEERRRTRGNGPVQVPSH